MSFYLPAAVAAGSQIIEEIQSSQLHAVKVSSSLKIIKMSVLNFTKMIAEKKKALLLQEELRVGRAQCSR